MLPLSALDVKLRRQMQFELKRIQTEVETTFIFVTHDPRIALLSDYRIVMKGGAVTHVLRTNDEEQELCTRVGQLDDFLSRLREKIRLGERLTAQEAEVLA